MESFQDVFDLIDRLGYFSPIDYDTQGGFARVVRVPLKSSEGSNLCAFKVMRHNLLDSSLGRSYFRKELELLRSFDQYRNVYPLLEIVTRIYDSGFVERRVSETIDRFGKPGAEWPIVRTGLDVDAFDQANKELSESDWVPFIMVEMAGYNDSLFRQIKQRPLRVDSGQGLFRLPTGEVLLYVTKLLDLISWMHESLGRAYIDWKPEHIHWSGAREKTLKIIDWNVTSPLDQRPGRKQNIRDDVRLLAGAALYCSLTLNDPEDGRPIGPRPTRDISHAVDESRRRYLTDDVNFHEAGAYLDSNIKKIIRKALKAESYESPDELKSDLAEYAVKELGFDIERANGIRANSVNQEEESKDAGLSYWMAIRNVREAQQLLSKAYEDLRQATAVQGENPEFDRLLKLVNNVQKNYPVP